MMAEVDRDHHWMFQALLQAKSAQIRLEDFIEFDLILAMDHQNLEDIQTLERQAIKRFGKSRVRS
ncbi:arsenate reductase/protein-tyrosine-phosphatase family protein, partial [Acinetobacter soli]|uniref:arsenate reductase/protein-tyrosine-phosphatase family protein n=1 Tax=Acinetobacter soli TaxID=487316 RepID=UPI00403A712A